MAVGLFSISNFLVFVVDNPVYQNISVGLLGFLLVESGAASWLDLLFYSLRHTDDTDTASQRAWLVSCTTGWVLSVVGCLLGFVVGMVSSRHPRTHDRPSLASLFIVLVNTTGIIVLFTAKHCPTYGDDEHGGAELRADLVNIAAKSSFIAFMSAFADLTALDQLVHVTPVLALVEGFPILNSYLGDEEVLDTQMRAGILLQYAAMVLVFLDSFHFNKRRHHVHGRRHGHQEALTPEPEFHVKDFDQQQRHHASSGAGWAESTLEGNPEDQPLLGS